MKYRVLVEIDAEDPEDALYSTFDPEYDENLVVLQIREEPFDTPSRMWNVSVSSNGYDLGRLR